MDIGWRVRRKGIAARRLDGRTVVVCKMAKTFLPTLLNVVQRCGQLRTRIPKGIPQPYSRPSRDRSTMEDQLLFHDDSCLIVMDQFPKSRVHCLVMPWDTRLLDLSRIGASHIPLLEHMEEVSRMYMQYMKTNNGSAVEFATLRFTTGFHAVPSLPMLHMHLISLDLESDFLKNKRHYNSFATHHFLPSARVVADVKAHGRVTLTQPIEQLEQLLRQPMTCLWCGEALGSIPRVKDHIPTCPKNQSRDVGL